MKLSLNKLADGMAIVLMIQTEEKKMVIINPSTDEMKGVTSFSVVNI